MQNIETNIITTKVFGYLILILLNVVFAGSSLNLLVSIPQILWVFVCIVKGDYKSAVFWHIVFAITSISPFSVDVDMLTLLSYARIKIVGLLSSFHIISIILFILIICKYKLHKQTLLYKFHRLLAYFLISGIGLGIIGLTIFNYVSSGFIRPSIYLLTLFIHVDMLVRCMDEDLLEKSFYTAIALLMASPSASVLSNLLFNISRFYVSDSDFRLSIGTSLDIFCGALLIGLLFVKQWKWAIIGSVFYLWNIMIGASGQPIMFFFIAMFILVCFASKKRINTPFLKRKKVIKIVLITILCCIVFIAPVAYSNMSGMTKYKLEQVTSLFNVFILPFDFDKIYEIRSSPYVRVVEIFNVVAEGFINPLKLLIGMGYGGYYTDVTGLMSNGYVNLEQGGFPPEIIADGRFPYTHIGFVDVFLFHGIIGFVWFFAVGIKYVKNIKNNFLSFSAIPVFFFLFFYNPLIALSGTFLLFASEYKLNVNHLFVENEKNIVHR
jgi:hypothetical protein